LDVNTSELRAPQGDVDGALGMAWWNALTEGDRRYWCFAAMTAVPAEAWRYFKSVTRDEEKSKVVCVE
jgi:hypothetical protein